MENVKSSAWGFLVKSGVNTFPIDPMTLNQKDLGITIASYDDAQEYIAKNGLHDYANAHKGFAVVYKDAPMVFYDNTLSYTDRNVVISHEIGHIILGHTTHNSIYGLSKDGGVDSDQEKEADLFALSFLAPAPVLLDMDVFSPTEIARLTGLSIDNSALISAHVSKEYSFRNSAQSLQLVNAYSDFIKKHKAVQKRKEKRPLLKLALVTICCLSLAVSVWFLSRPTQANSEPVDSIESIDQTFYVTPSGERYHLEDCRYVKNNGTPISFEEIKKEGYTPCKVCRPSAQ